MHGYGNWQAGYSTNGNSYLGPSSSETEWDGLDAALSVAARPMPRLFTHMQLAYRAKDELGLAHLDFAGVRFRIIEGLELELGQVAHPFGAHSLYDPGTTYPFALLPASSYGPSGLVAQYYRGFGLDRKSVV